MGYINYLTYLNRYVKKDKPVEITFFVTSRCNFRCKHCFNWMRVKDQDVDFINDQSSVCGEELTLAEIEKISKGMPDFLRLLISGGEPFLRSDLSKICEIFAKNNGVKHITIPTNGYFTKRIVRETEEILNSCRNAFINISLSLDELGNRRDNVVGVKDTFLKLENTYKDLCELKKRDKNLGVGVITTQTVENQERIKEIFEYARNDLRIDNFTFSIARGRLRNAVGSKQLTKSSKQLAVGSWHGGMDKLVCPCSKCIGQKTKDGEQLAVGGSPGADVNRLQSSMEFPEGLDVKKYEQMVGILLSQNNRRKRFDFPFSRVYQAKKELVYKNIIDVLKGKCLSMPCFSGRLRAIITETGDVFPCEHFMLEKKNMSMGNLRDNDYNFSKIWRTKKSKNVRDYIKRTRCFCTHECDLTMNVLFNMKNIPELILKSFKY